MTRDIHYLALIVTVLTACMATFAAALSELAAAPAGGDELRRSSHPVAAPARDPQSVSRQAADLQSGRGIDLSTSAGPAQ